MSFLLLWQVPLADHVSLSDDVHLIISATVATSHQDYCPIMLPPICPAGLDQQNISHHRIIIRGQAKALE